MNPKEPDPDNPVGAAAREDERLAGLTGTSRGDRWFRSLVQNSTAIIAIFDDNGTVGYMSPSVEGTLGYQPEELVGKSVFDYVHPEDVELVSRWSAEILENITPPIEFRLRAADGTWRHMVIRNNRFDDPDVEGIVVIARDVTERKKTQEALKESENRLQVLFENSSDVISLINPDNTIRYISPSVKRVLGYEPEELEGTLVSELVHQEDFDRFGRKIVEEIQSGISPSRPIEARYQHRDGSWRHLETTFNVLIDDPNVRGVVCTTRDVTERKEAEEALKQGEASLAEAQRIAHVGSWEWDVDSDTVVWSAELYRIFGRSPQEFENTYESFLAYVHPDDRISVEEAIREAYETGRPFAFEHRVVRPEGDVRVLQARGEVLTDEDGKPARMSGTAQDITERKVLEERLVRQAFHDSLTGLPNRFLFVDRLAHALERTRRRGDRMVAVLFMDLDGFKVINDSLGHEVGDRVLEAVSGRLKGCLRPEDTLARFGGDEFVVLIDEVEEPDEAVRVAERIIQELGTLFAVADRELFVRASIGIALGSARNKSPQDLLRDADTAMYRAKEFGSSYSVFESAMYLWAMERMELENDLKRAVEAEEFVIHYQPIVHLGDGAVWGLEALVRWNHPERGLLDPEEFVSIAEESGLVVSIGEAVLEEACLRAVDWQEEQPHIPPLVLSVNLSARQLARQDLAKTVQRVLRETGLEAGRLSLDITETVYIKAREGNTSDLDRLKELGVGICIDDFGTGYSSLSYLKHLPADALKIDRSFVKGLGEDLRDTAIVRMVIELAHTLGMEVIAEGVESKEQAALLSEMGCDMAQGYHFARPLPSEDVEPLLANRPAY